MPDEMEKKRQKGKAWRVRALERKSHQKRFLADFCQWELFFVPFQISIFNSTLSLRISFFLFLICDPSYSLSLPGE